MLLVPIREHDMQTSLSSSHFLIPGFDRSLFDHAWNRVRDYGPSTNDSGGVGMHEARHWHRRAYGGMVGGLPRLLRYRLGLTRVA